MPIPTVLRKHFSLLYAEFLATYVPSPEGQAHRKMYATCRETARSNWERVRTLSREGADYTDAALLGLLPHTSTSPEATRGGWVHWAPGFSDLRSLFLAREWATEADWPARAEILVNLLLAGDNGYKALAQACAAYAESPLSKGMQTGLVSPILNALWPDRYALCNAKSTLVVERFDGAKVSTQIAEYPTSSAAILRVADDLSEELATDQLDLGPADALDMFSHWLYAVKGWNTAPRYIKIAPGEDADDWQKCLSRGDIGVNWKHLGDLTGMDRKQFSARAQEVVAAQPDYTTMAVNQVWTLMRANVGDYVLATNGFKVLLGVGVITGEYVHAPDQPYCHRRAVDWFSPTPRQMNKTGWVKTVIDMNRSTFEDVVSGAPIHSFETVAADWLTLLRKRAGFGRPFEAPVYLETERDYKMAAVNLASELLGREALQALLAVEDYDEILSRIRTVGQKTNLLWLHVPVQGDLNIIIQEGLDRQAFCTAFNDLLWGADDSPTRLDKFVAFANRHSLPIRWTFPTYYLFLLHPDTDFYVKPSRAQWMLEELGQAANWISTPNARTYQAILDVCNQLLELLRPVGARDMVDAQGLVWVAHYMQDPKEMVGFRVAAPLDQVFAGRTEAEWALDLMRQTIEQLGISSPDDERLVVTYVEREHALKLIFCQVTPIQFWGGEGVLDRMRIALPDDEASAGLAKTFDFRSLEPAIGMYDVPNDALPAFVEQHRDAYYRALSGMREGMANHSTSGFRDGHVAEVGQALFSEDARKALLEHGFIVTPPPPPPVPAGYFTARTFELLAMLDAEPSYAVVQAHEGDFQAHLVEPFRELVTRAAHSLPQEWLSYLETQKNVIARMRKNDWGRGGAWPYLWGAFYPKSGRRISDAQLYVSVQSDQLQVGFAIGDHEKQVQERFWRNVATLVDELDDALWPNLAEDKRFLYGSADNPVTSLTEWLDSGQDTTVFVALSLEETLSLTREELDSHVDAILQKVWPLFLLAILDEPWPAIVAYLGIEQPDERNPIVSRAAVSARLSLPESVIAAWLAGLERKKQAILYGPPGTGKTYAARALADHLIGGGYGRTELVQFHPAYAYEDFIEGIRPETRDGQLSYEVKRGLLRAFCQEARQHLDSNFVLIIDEINRANLSRVFGELMYLLEYRGDEVRLAVSGQAFSIPKNVRIIGTMNTADRSIALVDHALRRRFAFIRLAPEWGIVERYFGHRDLAGVDLAALREELSRLNHEIEPDYRVGITFFLQDELGRHLASVWRMEIEPYLEEYFFDQPAKVESFRWENVERKVLVSAPHAD